jgi:hypothetical protein
MYAAAYASGQIVFDRRCPKGALPIAKGRERKLRPFIEVNARHGWQKGVLLVPGVPEAPGQVAALEALEKFITRLAKVADPVDQLTVFTRAHRWPIAGKGKQQ